MQVWLLNIVDTGYYSNNNASIKPH